MKTGSQLKVSSDRLKKLVIEPGDPLVQNHNFNLKSMMRSIHMFVNKNCVDFIFLSFGIMGFIVEL